MSDTPRTDGEAWRELEECNEVVCADFARELERELNAARNSIERVQHERDIWRERNEQATRAFNRVQQHFENIAGSCEEVRIELNTVD